MANEKKLAGKLAGKVLNDDELEGVAGGTRFETYADGNELYKRGLLSEDDALHSSSVRDLLHKMGYSGYKDHGGLAIFGSKGNVYTDKNGNSVSREDFWKNFDAENGTKIIR